MLIAAWLLAFIVFTGAAVRLTQSGLGCEDWPTCSEDRLVPEFTYHGWVEFGNRLLSGVVSIGVIAAVLGAYRRVPRRPDLIKLAWGLVVGVLAQIVWGGMTVLVGLHPFFVSVHFLLSMMLLWNAIVLLVRSGTGSGPATPIAPALIPHLRLVAALGVAILISGTVVTGTGPHSGDSRADRLSLDLSSVVRVHSVIAWVFLAALLGLMWRVRSDRQATSLYRATQPVLAAVVVQGAIGYTQYFTGVPAILVFLHIVGATALWCALVWMYLSFFTRPLEVPIEQAGSTNDLLLDQSTKG